MTDTVKVNGKEANCLYDTGLSYDAIVSESLVSRADLTDKTVDLQGADLTKPTTTCPIAWIEVESRYVTGRIQAAVLQKPLYDLVLGCRYVFLGTPPKTVE
ncbi:aspartyl protease family protein, partial [Acinetobacter baumannii]|uniref:aspartyl protease family protein n=1 Tax=Acinetobacter baumannii TaxID=470 RepID=UPI003394C507